MQYIPCYAPLNYEHNAPINYNEIVFMYSYTLIPAIFLLYSLYIKKQSSEYNANYIIKHLNKSQITEGISLIKYKYAGQEEYVLSILKNINDLSLTTLYLYNNDNFKYNMSYLIKLHNINTDIDTAQIIVKLMAKMVLENMGYLFKYPKFKHTFTTELRKTGYSWVENYIILVYYLYPHNFMLC